MENKVKGTRYDVGNDCQYCWYCSVNDKYHCHSNQYHTDCKDTQTSKKQPPLAKVEVAFFDKHLQLRRTVCFGSTFSIFILAFI